ncbi:MAG: DUF4926 domain-containing protein [Caldilineaceae bacterium]|nr:DUF4926 domain-containing protein [Caldilineaceae bacterium]
MIKELDRVVLASELPEHGLKVGDIGTVVLIHDKGNGYEVEFVSLDGEPVVVVSLLADQVRTIRRHEVPHARLLAAP